MYFPCSDLVILQEKATGQGLNTALQALGILCDLALVGRAFVPLKMLKPALSCPCPLPPPHPLALSFCMLAIPAWKFLNPPCYVTPCVWHMLFLNLVELVISCITSWWICVFWRFFFCEVCVQVFRSFFYWDVFCFLINSQAFLYVQHTSSTHCKYFFFCLWPAFSQFLWSL